MAVEYPPRPGFSFGGAPPPAVAAYFRDKTLRPAFRWTEVWGEEHASAFTVAKTESLEVLGAIKGALQRAIDEGVPFERFAKELQPELEKQGWWGSRPMRDPATGELRDVQLGSKRRLRTVFDSNLRTARAAGQWERIERTKAVLPFLAYELGPSAEHRPEHVAKQGTILPVDHPFWTDWFPPNGWGCKCWVRGITKAEAGRRGGASADPVIERKAYVRIRDDGTRETVRVPEGIDPGWAGNPGLNRAKLLKVRLAEKAAALPPPVARAAVGEDLWDAAGLGPLPRMVRPGPEVLQPRVPVELETGEDSFLSFDWSDERPEDDEPVLSRDQAVTFGNRLRQVVEGELGRMSFDGRVQGDYDDYPGGVTVELRDRRGLNPIKRTFHRGDGVRTVSHDLFDLQREHQGKGLAARVLGSSLDFYLRTGMERIEVHAALSRGGYVWAKVGFEPIDPRAFRREFDRGLARGVNAGEITEDAAEAAIEALADHGDRGVAQFAAELMLDDVHVGKVALMGADWYGTMDLTDVEAVARMRRYTDGG